ncbi:MAG: transcriptional regulator HexR [Pseudomonadales bacterium]
MKILSQLSSPDSALSKSARKIAAVVLEDPEMAINSSISSLATASGVSEPTVNRFCRALGCKGFPDFKVTLAQELANNPPKMTRDVDPDDSIADVIEKIFDSTHASLSASQLVCSSATIERAIDLLTQARSIMFYGLGASGSVALDAQHKFLRFDTPVIAHTDNLNQRMTAAGLSHQDVAVCISYTGRTLDIIEVAKIVSKTGAGLIGITASNSPLAESCDLILPVDSAENTDVYTPMTSRIDHLVLIDILATGFALKRGPQLVKYLQRTTGVLRDTRAPTTASALESGKPIASIHGL